ncbi:septum formation family protein [Nocardioides sp. NPDC101246]|uniref:septum formation family protein n=1 Tax=Nocardioides sp. NPDC101246 TaxID=3364336 RepID=UPI0037F4B1F7
MDAPPLAVEPQAEQSQTLAWIALALNLVWVPPLGMVIGILDTFLGLACTLVGTTLAVLVLLRSRHGIDHGRLPAWIAVSSAAAHLTLTLALGLILAVTTHPIDDPESLETTEDVGWPLPPEELVTGDCLLSVERPTTTLCNEPHRVEVAGTYTLSDTDRFDDAETDADPLCNRSVAAYLGVPADEAASRYGFSISADKPHRVACWAVSEDAITGTMRATRP